MEVTKNISQKHQTLYSPTPRGRGWDEAFGCGAGCPTSVRPSCARRRTCRRQSHRHRPQNGRPGIDTVNLFFGSMFAVQCDQIGWFVKVLGNKKVAQFFVAFSATLKNFDCPVKPNIFWQNLESFGLLFIPISGHTGWHCDLFTKNPWSWIKLRQNSRNFV